MTELSISAILCAAGQSVRMGENNKLLLKIGDLSMIAHMIKELVSSNITEIIVVLGHQQHLIRKEIGPHLNKIKIVLNDEFEKGQTSSIQTGIRHINTSCDAIMICLSDMPLLRAHHYNQMIGHFIQNHRPGHVDITRPVCGVQPGHPVLLDRCMIPELLSCKEQYGCRSVIQKHREKMSIYKSCDTAFFTDIDSPEDMSATLLLK